VRAGNAGRGSEETAALIEIAVIVQLVVAAPALRAPRRERGTGVAIVRSDRELASYLALATGDTIVQKYVAGMEFGIFYYRLPDNPRAENLFDHGEAFPGRRRNRFSQILPYC
jgi:hypothetical protein